MRDADEEYIEMHAHFHIITAICAPTAACLEVQKIAPTSRLRKHMHWKHKARKPVLHSRKKVGTWFQVVFRAKLGKLRQD